MITDKPHMTSNDNGAIILHPKIDQEKNQTGKEDSMNFTIENNRIELKLSMTKACIEIIETERDDVVLEFSKLRKKTISEIFNISYRNSRLFIRENLRSRSHIVDSIFSYNLNTDLILKVPIGTDISGTISTVSGDIKAKTLNFCGELKTISGAIDINSIDSDRLELQDISGNVKIGEFNGFMKGKVLSGTFCIQKGTIKELSLKSVTGDVSITSNFELENDSDISTVSGNIDVNILGFKGDRNIYLSTLSGATSVKGDYPEENVHVKRRITFLKNHPFKSVVPSMKDFFSSVFSMTDNDDVEVETKPKESTKKNTTMILQMLSEGKISAEEAEKLLNALHQQ